MKSRYFSSRNTFVYYKCEVYNWRQLFIIKLKHMSVAAMLLYKNNFKVYIYSLISFRHMIFIAHCRNYRPSGYWYNFVIYLSIYQYCMNLLRVTYAAARQCVKRLKDRDPIHWRHINEVSLTADQKVTF